MNFASPQAFWFLAILPILWLLAFASRGEHASRSLLGATALRTLTVLSLVVALAQPQMMLPDQGISVVYAIDISRSVAPDFLGKTQEWIRATNERYRPTETHFVAFAEQARMFASIDDLSSVLVSRQQHTDDPAAIAQGATDIERGLRAALSAFGPFHERRVVLISDGRQTQGDLWRMLPRLQSEKVHVFTMPAPVATTSDAWVDAIVAPDGVRMQEPVNLIVRVVATAAMPAHVKLTRGKQQIGMTTVTLRPGPNDVAFETMLPKLGMNTLTASVRADADHFADNDNLTEGIWAGPRPRVLYVEGVPESAHYLADALRAHHIEVTVSGPDELIRNRPSMSGFDAIILSDVYQQSLEPLADSLEKFVRDSGGGLIFVSGESTFGKQGLAGSRIERLLPVRFEGKRKRLDLDLVLLIDRSHSMRGRKLEMAKTAALSTLDMLEERHRLAVVAFDVRAHPVVPLAPVGNKRRAEDSIASITASGQTNIFPALAEAQRMLAGSTATTKHIILLSDGITAELPTKVSDLPDAAQIHALIQKAREEDLRHEGIVIPRPEAPEPIPEIGAIEAQVAELNQSNITVSTIAIGEKPNLSLMRNIAAVGRGRSYVAHYDAEIPGLFVSETRRLLGESIVEENFRPVVAHAVASVNGLDFTSGPPLRGIVVSRPKVFSDVLLQGPRQLPLLVTTRYGLGKTAAFLSDAKNRWSSDWIGWAGYGQFWANSCVMSYHAVTVAT